MTGVQACALPISTTRMEPRLSNDDQRGMQVGRAGRGRGIGVGGIRPPTVPSGSGRLRITFSASHSEEQVDQLLDALDRLGISQ